MVVLNADGTALGAPVGGATSANQTNGSQKTQIVDAGGDAVTVTGGKLDVNASIDTTGLATSAKQDTIIGHVDGIETSLSSIDGKITAVNTGAVDVLTLPALAAGTNAIGKLLPPDIDITTHTNYAKKYYTNAGAVTDGIIWSPAAGKRWHIVSMIINTSAAATITLEDDKAGGDEVVWKGEIAANSGFPIHFGEKYPLASGEDAADLLVTTSAGNIYITCVGYEI